MKNLTKIFMAVAVAMFAFACVTDTTEDLGIKVEVRPVPYTEIKKFQAVAALGTAVVITPVWEITRGKEVIKVSDPNVVHPTLQKLYDRVQGIQYVSSRTRTSGASRSSSARRLKWAPAFRN